MPGLKDEVPHGDRLVAYKRRGPGAKVDLTHSEERSPPRSRVRRVLPQRTRRRQAPVWRQGRALAPLCDYIFHGPPAGGLPRPFRIKAVPRGIAAEGHSGEGAAGRKNVAPAWSDGVVSAPRSIHFAGATLGEGRCGRSVFRGFNRIAEQLLNALGAFLAYRIWGLCFLSLAFLRSRCPHVVMTHKNLHRSAPLKVPHSATC